MVVKSCAFSREKKSLFYNCRKAKLQIAQWGDSGLLTRFAANLATQGRHIKEDYNLAEPTCWKNMTFLLLTVVYFNNVYPDAMVEP